MRLIVFLNLVKVVYFLCFPKIEPTSDSCQTKSGNKLYRWQFYSCLDVCCMEASSTYICSYIPVYDSDFIRVHVEMYFHFLAIVSFINW